MKSGGNGTKSVPRHWYIERGAELGEHGRQAGRHQPWTKAATLLVPI
jgi:hypothetical protein